MGGSSNSCKLHCSVSSMGCCSAALNLALPGTAATAATAPSHHMLPMVHLACCVRCPMPYYMPCIAKVTSTPR